MNKKLLTTSEVVVSKGFIYAEPVTEPNAPRPFKYYIHTGSTMFIPDEHVRVCEVSLNAMVPAGLNLVEQAIETLEKKQEDIMTRAYEQRRKIETYKQSLLLLTDQSTDDFVTGEAVTGRWGSNDVEIQQPPMPSHLNTEEDDDDLPF